MNAAEFEEVALALIGRGYSPIPIMPGSKSPGWRNYDGSWDSMPKWNRWCREQPTEHTVAAWLRMIRDGETSIGVACGRGLVCIDIDQEYLLDPVLAILPPSQVQKKGRKGISIFYRGNTEKIRSRNYRTGERVGLVDLLAEGRQTVLPPSIHPDTNEPYYWWTDATLSDVTLEDLPELPDDIADQIGEVLKAFGYDPEAERPAFVRGETPARSDGAARASNIYRQANDDALANLDCWIPALNLYRWRRKLGGYEAVAHWRSSGTGRALELRKRNLSIVRKGIEDFGDGRKYTPIDLVMAARGCDADIALGWLLERLPDDTPKIVLINGPKTLERIRARGGM